MTPRIIPAVRRCALRACQKDGTHDVIDAYGKKIGAYCLEHAQAVLATLVASGRRLLRSAPP